MFEYQLELIRQLGFGGWLRTYPVNPVTMIAGVVVLGIIVVIVNAKVRKRRALDNKPAHDAATVVVQRRNAINSKWADNVSVDSVNGGKAHWFFHKAVQAVYLAPGENEVVVHAKWAERRQGKIVFLNTPAVTLKIDVSADGIYALHYHFGRQKYLLTEGDRFEDDAFDNGAQTGVWLG